MRWSRPGHDVVGAARRFYADELRSVANLTSGALYAAFAEVPRERFVGPGPWRIISTLDLRYRTTDNADPRHVYHDILIALDEACGFNNGQPSFWAFLIDKLSIVGGETIVHLGCGTGYYTAILAEMVGRGGKVRAIERHEGLAKAAREALVPWPQVSVEVADGSSVPLDRADIIVASAGATHPLPGWLDALESGGRLLLPLTSSEGPGGMLRVIREDEKRLAARFISSAAFVDFGGARDLVIGERLASALRKDRGMGVKSLRRDQHDADESCWLHGGGWCLSRRDPA